MDWGAAKRVMGIPNNTAKINWWDFLFHDIWSGSGYVGRDKLSNTKISHFSLDTNDELMVKQLDSLEERQEVVTIQLANYQQKLARRYDKGVRTRELALVTWYYPE